VDMYSDGSPTRPYAKQTYTKYSQMSWKKR